MIPNSEDVFDGIESVKVFTKNPFFLPGRYIVRIEKVKMITTRLKGKAWVNEAKILESTNPERVALSYATQLIMANNDSFQRNVKAFVFALYKVPKGLDDPDQVTKAMIQEVISDENPAEGQILRLECIMTKTKAGRDFTIHNWYAGEDADWDKYGNVAA